ncbi:MAG TPA: MurR/RpiR family transcriptional regulator [Thermohalobaculum sp.]|nr:MurR/RpiR family transcriptional regulator [Thermohalobaculum sp.]
MADHGDGLSLMHRVHAEYAGLPASERKVADLVIDFPGELAAYTASELAELAEVSNATVTRFFRRLGYDSFEEARRSARRAREWGSPLFLASKASEREAIGSDLVKRFADEETGIVAATFAALDPAVLGEATDALAGARRLFFLGFRNSGYIAGYGRWQFIQFRGDVHMLTGGGETLAERIADLGPGDLVVLVGLRRLVRRLARYAEAARDAGADILLVTDPTARGTAAYARWTITCPVENPHVLDSYAGVIGVLRLLAVETMYKLGRSGRERLQQVERLHERLGEFE